MQKLTKENTTKFLADVNFLEGGNVERVDFVLANSDGKIPFSYVDIYAYPEGASLYCKLRLIDIISFRFEANHAAVYFGLSGYPRSLEILWSESSVLLAIDANENEQSFEQLKKSDFWVEAKEIEFDIVKS